MNKSLRALLAVIVLAFAAAGMYYAWFAPSKPAIEKVDGQKKLGSKLTLNNGAPTDNVITDTSGASTTSTAVAVSVPLRVQPTSTTDESVIEPRTASSAANIPEGFEVDTTPMQPLPTTLPGFTPTTATGSAIVAAAATQMSATSANGDNASMKSPATSDPSSTMKKPAATTTSSSATVLPSGSGSLSAPGNKYATTSSNSPASGTASTKSMTAATSSSSTASSVHVVVEGDTLTSIAKQYWGTSQGWENIEKANPGLTPTNLKLGAKLNIPSRDASVMTTKSIQSVSNASTVAGSSSTTGDYEIVSGDTLSKISNKVYGDAKHWKQIYEANKKVIGEDAAVLVVGTKLAIPAKSTSDAKSSMSTSKPTAMPVTLPKASSAGTNSSATGVPTTGAAKKPVSTQSSAPMGASPNNTPNTSPASKPASTQPISAQAPKTPINSSTPTLPSSTPPTSAPTPTPPIGSPTKPL